MSEAALQLDDFNTTDLRPLADRMLEETYRRYLGLGLAPAAAAEAAVAEFGDPRLIAAAFARMHPARLAARRLLAIGPVVGTGWVVALVTGRAWTWPVPVLIGIVPGLTLVAAAALLGVAVISTRYRSVARFGAAGCIGVMMLDLAMITGVMVADPALSWAAGLAMTLSAARFAYCARCWSGNNAPLAAPL